VYRDALIFANSDAGLALIRLAVTEANRDEQAAELYRAFLQRRIHLMGAALDRARQRGEPISAAADATLLVDWMAGLLILRAITGQPMPAVGDADHLAALTMRSISDG
jgi:hypothetical protein